jgi:hypothetical protein
VPGFRNHPDAGNCSCGRRAPARIFRPTAIEGSGMFNWIRRRRLTPQGQKRLLLVAARAEEALVETHVANVLDLLATLSEEIDFDRALEIYSEMMSLEDARATTVANRVLARLEAPAPLETRKRKPGESALDRRYKNVFRGQGR